MEFTNLPKESQIPVTFNDISNHTGRNAIIKKISTGDFKKPEETIVKCCLGDTGEEVQTRILGLVNPRKVLIQLGLHLQ